MHHNYEDSDSGYEVDADNKGKSFGVGGYKGRIIFLGDGTEVLTDSDDTEMFDNADEDKDLASQVAKSSSSSNNNETTAVVAKDTESTDITKTESTADSTSAEAKKTDETTKAESKKD